MRYLSDDGKVFNTLEECNNHEAKTKRDEEEKAKEEAKAKDINNLLHLLDEVRAKTDELEKAMTAFDKKWDSNIAKNKLSSGFSMADMLMDYFG